MNINIKENIDKGTDQEELNNHLKSIRSKLEKQEEIENLKCIMHASSIIFDNEAYLLLQGDLYSEIISKYDNYAFANKEKIKPFFFGFEAKIPFCDALKIIEKFETRLDVRKCSWLHHFYFDCNEECKMMEDNSTSKIDLCTCIIHVINKYIDNLEYSVSLKSNNDAQENKVLIRANVYFCNSPIIRVWRYLTFDVSNKNIYKDDFDANSLKKQSKQSLNLSNFNVDEILAYNVGQGNLSLLKSNDKEIGLIDVGMTVLEDCNTFSAAIDMLENYDGDYLFLTHYDIDHIIGFGYLSDRTQGHIKMISPDIRGIKLSLSAKRLLSYIAANNNLYLVDNMNNKKFNTPNIEIYKGDGSSSEHCNANNSNGLIFNIVVNGKNALFPGDCLYHAFPNTIDISQKSFMYVPHHGCMLNSMEEKELDNQMGKCSLNKDVTCFVSYGYNNYNHPSTDHLNKLETKFTVEESINHVYYYEFK